MFMYNIYRYCAEVTCPHCSAKKWYPLSTLVQEIKRPNFTGQCRACGLEKMRAGKHQKLRRKPSKEKRKLSQSGYVLVSPYDIAEEDLPLFYAAKNRNGLLEHRFVMAKHLGRPLKSYELVDHKDGNKTNNKIGNLRIYRRGKNEEGSSNGWGTYYHEWQMALAEIEHLKAKLAVS